MSRGVKFGLVGFLLCVGLAALSPLASDAPDGLDSVLEKQGLADLETSTYVAPIPDYASDAGPARKAVAGILGTGLVFVLTFGAGYALRRPSTASQ